MHPQLLRCHRCSTRSQVYAAKRIARWQCRDACTPASAADQQRSGDRELTRSGCGLHGRLERIELYYRTPHSCSVVARGAVLEDSGQPAPAGRLKDKVAVEVLAAADDAAAAENPLGLEPQCSPEAGMHSAAPRASRRSPCWGRWRWRRRRRCWGARSAGIEGQLLEAALCNALGPQLPLLSPPSSPARRSPPLPRAAGYQAQVPKSCGRRPIAISGAGRTHSEGAVPAGGRHRHRRCCRRRHCCCARRS